MISPLLNIFSIAKVERRGNKRLKKGYITQQQFDEQEQKARNKDIKKRSKIIKEVNEQNEKKILNKILRKKKRLERENEESKNNNTQSLIKVSIRHKMNFWL